MAYQHTEIPHIFRKSILLNELLNEMTQSDAEQLLSNQVPETAALARTATAHHLHVRTPNAAIAGPPARRFVPALLRGWRCVRRGGA